MSTIGGNYYRPGPSMMRDGMRDLRKKFPMFRDWPLLAIRSHLTWVGLPKDEARGPYVNDNQPRHK